MAAKRCWSVGRTRRGPVGKEQFRRDRGEVGLCRYEQEGKLGGRLLPRIVRDAELVDDALLRDGGGTVIHGVQWHV